MLSTAPFWPQFGTGAPGPTVPTNQLYYDTSTSPFTGYVFELGSWHTTGGSGSGSVSSVGLALPASVFTISGSPVTTAGTLTGAFANQSANAGFMGPVSGGAATPAFRALVANDIPASLNATNFANGSAPNPGVSLNTNYGIFYDTVNSGIGISVAGSQLGFFAANLFELSSAAIQTIIQADGQVNFSLQRFSTDATAPAVIQAKARGTRASPSVLITNDVMGAFNFQGYNGASFTVGAQFRAVCIDTTPSATAMGTSLRWLCCAIGSVADTEAMRVEQQTGLSLFGANPVIDQNRVFRNRIFTVSTLPTGVQGMETYVSDATQTLTAGIGAVVAGGSTNPVPVNYDGTNWRIG